MIKNYLNGLNETHPIRIYIEENNYIKSLIQNLKKANQGDDLQLKISCFNEIARVDIRYTRKENQLFPYLEKRGWLGPSHGMWRFHDSIRALIRDIRQEFELGESENLHTKIGVLNSELERMIEVEEGRLFPISLELLTDEDWQDMQKGEIEIGWMHIQKKENSRETLGVKQSMDSLGTIFLSEGSLSAEQIDLLLQVMPFDLTFVDENDRVRFYNRGEQRVFPRSAGVIGREVRYCHPPKSVSTVLRILEEFRAGTKDEAEFWIQFRGRTIHIRYFAVRDSQKIYRGVIEVSQDITDIKKITGEKRLLDWQ